MKLLSLNCQGLGNPVAVSSFESVIRFHKPQVVFLMETKLSNDKWEKTRYELGFEDGDGVPADGNTGGLCLFWKKEVKIKVKISDKNHMDVKRKEADGDSKWRFIGVYGCPEKENHHLTWDLIRNLHCGNDESWLCAGDFNQISSNAEKVGGRLVQEQKLIGFNNALSDSGLMDLSFRGYPFTWEKKRDVLGLIEEHLDREVANKK
ncbi:unnamed protein product [Linum trigynum]|uniref:Endonuclease/exonuclease/phosphatase domain-containing protein n=1 Tax=Linum trigynum TaxID=586398 RepID=A0AAV2GCB5_9ROSI